MKALARAVLFAVVAASGAEARIPAALVNERLRAIVGEQAVPSEPAPQAKPRVVAESSGAEPHGAPSHFVSGTRYASASAYMPCPRENSGSRSGFVFLSENVPVSNSDGAYGTAWVSASAFVSGRCYNGYGSLSGYANVSGSGAVYDSHGRFLGTAFVTGSAFLNGYGSDSVWLSGYLTVSGSW